MVWGAHSWAFLCTNEGVLAWEQGMVGAERTGAAVGAGQACVRFEHPAMVQELANMEPVGGEGERVFFFFFFSDRGWDGE